MRKKTRIYYQLLILGAVMSSLLSCYGGKDSDVTDDIQQVTAINGIATDGSYTLYQGDTLRINPSLTFSVGADSLRYDYRWVVGKQQEISTGKQLVWEVSLPSGYNMATDIPAVFIAKDRENGLEFRKTFSFQVLSTYTPSSIVVYQKSDGRTEWMSLQGDVRAFTKYYPDMIERINPDEPIKGKYYGTLYALNEIAVFTDQSPSWGRCISMRNADPDNGFYHNVGEYTGNIYNKVYMGSASRLDISNVTFGYGASKYFICNGNLHVFNGLDRKLPVFNENTFVKSRNVRQAMSSKQFQRFKKVTFVLHDDNTVGCYHVYNDQMEHITIDGEPFRLDSLCGCFTEATGMGSNQPYEVYLIGKRDGEYAIYEFCVNYVKTTVQPISLKRIMPIDASLARTVRYWWGSFGESYAFYSVGNKVYRFDYYNMKEFNPVKSKLLISLDEGEQLVDVFPLITGLGLRDEDDCTVMLTYRQATGSSSIRVYDSVTGKLIKAYQDIIPGYATYFTRCL